MKETDDKLKTYLRQHAPVVPPASPIEYQLIMRRVRQAESQRRGRYWQLGTLSFASVALLSLLVTQNPGAEDGPGLSLIDETPSYGLNSAEWVSSNPSEAYQDWLWLAESAHLGEDSLSGESPSSL